VSHTVNDVNPSSCRSSPQQMVNSIPKPSFRRRCTLNKFRFPHFLFSNRYFITYIEISNAASHWRKYDVSEGRGRAFRRSAKKRESTWTECHVGFKRDWLENVRVGKARRFYSLRQAAPSDLYMRRRQGEQKTTTILWVCQLLSYIHLYFVEWQHRNLEKNKRKSNKSNTASVRN